MKDLLLIIDMQNVYLPGRPWACPSMPAAILQIQKLLDSSHCRNNYDIIFTRYIASEHPSGCWIQYNKQNADISRNAYLNQIIPQFQPCLMKWPFYDKSTYSACSIPQIMERLNSCRRVVLTGVVAECCVLFTAQRLIDSGVQVIYLKDAVAGQNTELEASVCRLMEKFIPVHTLVMTVDDYLSEMQL